MFDVTGATAAASSTNQSMSEAALGALGGDTFLKLLVAQLRYQNPLEPTDGTAMLQQTAQFTTVETLQAISESQQRLMGLYEVGLAMSTVGHEVSAIDANGIVLTGTVDGLRFTSEGPMLQIDGLEVPLENVIAVESDPEITEVVPDPSAAGSEASEGDSGTESGE